MLSVLPTSNKMDTDLIEANLKIEDFSNYVYVTAAQLSVKISVVAS